MSEYILLRDVFNYCSRYNDELGQRVLTEDDWKDSLAYLKIKEMSEDINWDELADKIVGAVKYTINNHRNHKTWLAQQEDEAIAELRQREDANFSKEHDAMFPPKDYEILQTEKSNERVITKVKRCSDGEVFAVGQDDEEGRIDGFGFENGRLVAYLHCGVFKDFSNLKHRPAPLFTTKDGKAIYEGDNVWEVNEYFKMCVFRLRKDDYIQSLYTERKFFSTEQAARDYIEKNKPCVSLKDVLECCYGNDLSGWINKKKLTELVRQKLHQ